jgi:hypothetical protein
MAASAADIARLRRMAAEPTTTTYTDAVLSTTIERYPVRDADGLAPTDTDWTATYDLNSAASDVWSEKAAALASAFDFTADGADFKRSQAAQQAQSMASYYRSRRYARGVPLAADINDDSEEWIGNLPEED